MELKHSDYCKYHSTAQQLPQKHAHVNYMQLDCSNVTVSQLFSHGIFYVGLGIVTWLRAGGSTNCGSIVGSDKR
jgi:hypothetical protein